MKINELSPSVPRKCLEKESEEEIHQVGVKQLGKVWMVKIQEQVEELNLILKGGQNAYLRRVPKRGFSKCNFQKDYAVITIDTLNQFNDGDVVTPESLYAGFIVKNLRDGVKVLANGELTKKLTVKVHKISKAAKAIEAKGGSVRNYRS